MQCENGYVKKGVHGILCKKAEEPKDGDLRGIAHALCGHQRFCPNQKCYTMLPGWEKCMKRENAAKAAGSFDALTLAQDDAPIGADAPLPPEGEASREEGAGEEIAPKKTKRTAKKKSAEAGAESAEKGEEA